jgi:hypothetical protein
MVTIVQTISTAASFRCADRDEEPALAHPRYPATRVRGLADSRDQIVSGTISIAPHGHSATQIPQPLQKS